MRNTFKVLFYIKKTAPLRNGNVPIMGRITINGQCTQFATQLSVQPELWNVSFSCVMGRSALARASTNNSHEFGCGSNYVIIGFHSNTEPLLR